jgi:hypothetical protein
MNHFANNIAKNQNYQPRSPSKPTLSPRKTTIHPQSKRKPSPPPPPPSTRLPPPETITTTQSFCQRWLLSKRALEYRGIDQEERNAKIDAVATFNQLDRITTKHLPSLQSDLRNIRSKLIRYKNNVTQLQYTVKELQQRVDKTEKLCQYEAAHLLEPIHRSLESIASVDNPTLPSMFTVKALTNLIPSLPKSKAKITFDPEAEQLAQVQVLKKFNTLKRNREKGILLTRQPRTANEIIITALLIIAEPKEYQRIALAHCSTRDLSNSACGDDDDDDDDDDYNDNDDDN